MFLQSFFPLSSLTTRLPFLLTKFDFETTLWLYDEGQLGEIYLVYYIEPSRKAKESNMNIFSPSGVIINP